MISYVRILSRLPGVLLFLLTSDNVQHDLQHGSLITFPKEENLANNIRFFVFDVDLRARAPSIYDIRVYVFIAVDR